MHSKYYLDLLVCVSIFNGWKAAVPVDGRREFVNSQVGLHKFVLSQKWIALSSC